MKRTLPAATLALGAALALAGCGSGSSSDTSGNAEQSGSIHVSQTSLGKVLVDGDGMTVYLLTSDKPNQSNCNSTCLSAWPLVPASQGQHAKGVTAKVDHTAATSGTQIATVGGWPLYTYAQDAQPGDVTGEGIRSFGGVWYAVSPNGKPVKETSSPASTKDGDDGNGY